MDSQIDLRALQAIGIAEGARRILRVWYNDGRIRDWDCRVMLETGKGKFAALIDAATFVRAATVWDGAPGFDLGGRHDEADCLDFDPYEVWTDSTDVTRYVQEQEHACGRSDLLADLPEAAEDSPAYGKGCVCR